MNARKRFIVAGIAGIAALVLALDVTGSIERYLASVFPPSPISPAYLQKKYADERPIRILLVPGHETAVPGTSFDGYWERNLNIEVGEALKARLDADPHFDVSITQNALGYLPEFERYFATEWGNIRQFIATLRGAMREFVRSGIVAKKTDGVVHNTAHPEIGARLYGINKWARDNAVDIVLHLHFNDYPGHAASAPGEYTGFAIYIPEHQFPNFSASSDVAFSVFRELARYFPASSHPQEAAGILEDQDLIAVGASASLDAAAILIEYSYIYEPQVVRPALRPLATAELAEQTYNGLKRYFEKSAAGLTAATLPYRWTWEFAEGARHEPDVFALQIALSRGGWYPPAGKTRTNCPTSGTFGPCTREALRAFQSASEIPESGALDAQTITALNARYSH